MLNICRADKMLLAGGAALLGSSFLFGATPLSLGIPAGAFAALMADGVFRPASGLLHPTISRGSRERPLVALTFDDGPDPQVTPRVLDALGACGARATFFVIGRHVEQRATIAERIVAEGHELGNHSWTHSYFQNFYDRRRQADDIERNRRLIRQISGREPLYRPPVGLKSPALARIAHAAGMTIVAWSLHSRDTYARDPDAVAARVLARVRPGDIVLLHDGHERASRQRLVAATALPAILRGLQARRLQPVSVSELLHASETMPDAMLRG